MPRLACHSPLLHPIEILLRRIGKRVQFGELGGFTSYVLSSNESALGGEVACAGRRPVGLTSRSVDLQHSRLGDYLASVAHLEAASVIAFERLAQELTEHGAPEPLIADALAARADEVRHAETIAALARARGGEPVAVEVEPWSARSLSEIALDNAVEGCVRETYGALVGAHQATRAKDLELRLAMRMIAPDEGRHAALSHRVHLWTLSALDDAQRDQVRRAQVEAVFELARECALPPDAELMEAAGLPDSGLACALLGELTRELWLPRAQQAA